MHIYVSDARTRCRRRHKCTEARWPAWITHADVRAWLFPEECSAFSVTELLPLVHVPVAPARTRACRCQEDVRRWAASPKKGEIRRNLRGGCVTDGDVFMVCTGTQRWQKHFREHLLQPYSGFKKKKKRTAVFLTK